MEINELIGLAFAAKEKAYAPYSGFRVGAALLCADGEVYTGCNIEAAGAVTVCAERTALVKAVSCGSRDFALLAVCSDAEYICTPCGTCRQMLYEFAPEMPVICCASSGEYRQITVRELLPHAFGEDKNEQ